MTSRTNGSGGLGSAILGSGAGGSQNSRTVSTQRIRVLSPGEIAGIRHGHALHLDGTTWELVTVTPAHRVEPWVTLTGGSVPAGR